MAEKKKCAYCSGVIAGKPYVETVAEKNVRSMQKLVLTSSKRRNAKD